MEEKYMLGFDYLLIDNGDICTIAGKTAHSIYFDIWHEVYDQPLTIDHEEIFKDKLTQELKKRGFKKQ